LTTAPADVNRSQKIHNCQAFTCQAMRGSDQRRTRLRRSARR
jgi:hypothetical protein